MMRRIALLIALIPSACTSDGGSPPPPEPTFTAEQRMDPASCVECHAEHHGEWAGSMHAYASTDPIFRAINAKGQEETDGALGDFCVRCHAPVALALGLTVDGLNLDEVPAWAQGITCYFCHSVDAVNGTHNNPLSLADDGLFRGPYADPVPNQAHASLYSPLLDGDRRESADLCGACHDIVTPDPHRVHLERTYSEWKGSLFSDESGDFQTCANCHMPTRKGVAADAPGVGLREIHDHRMAGVDVALVSFPDTEGQLAAVQKSLDTTIFADLCVESLGNQHTIEVKLENIGAGHSWPSGATIDRRAWVELKAADANGVLVHASGVVADDESLASQSDPERWDLHQRAVDKNEEPTHDFWSVSEVLGELLPAPSTLDVTDPRYLDTHRTRTWAFEAEDVVSVTMRVRLRPIGLEILEGLVEEGWLAEGLLDAMPTFTLALTELEWTPELGTSCVQRRD